MNINLAIAIRLSLLVSLALVLSAASSRLHADVQDTGTCGGVTVTLPFTDVMGSQFFCQIAEAYFSGLANGTSGTTYSPGNNVTRDQMAAFITRTLDQSLKRGSSRGALDQWATPTSVPFTAKTTVGDHPVAVKSDGEDLWVANFGSATVSRVHASDGKLLQTWTGASNARAVLVARGRVFVVGRSNPGTIYVIDPAQPAGAVTLLTNTLPQNPLSIAFDGFNLWVASSLTGIVSKVNPNTGAVTSFSGFTNPLGVIYDGSNIWITELGADTLKKLDSNGNVLQTVNVGFNPQHPIYDGTNIWVPKTSDDTVTVVRASTGAVLATLSNNGLSFPEHAAFDGERILITNASSTVSLWKASDLTPLGSFSGATFVTGACSDGLSFWLTLDDGPPGHLVRF